MQSKTLNIKSFYDEVAISKFNDKSVVYIGYIGRIKNEHIFNYGLSRNNFERDYKQHSKKFDKFKVVYIGETNNCEEIETLFEQDLKVYGLHRNLWDFGVEFFTVSIKHTIESLVEHIKDLIISNPLPSAKEVEEKITKYKIEIYENLMELQKLELQKLELQKLELQFMMSDDYLERKELEIRGLIEERKTLKLRIKLEQIKQGHYANTELIETPEMPSKIVIKKTKEKS